MAKSFYTTTLRSRLIFLIILLKISIGTGIFAQVAVTITAPQLKPGMLRIQSMLDQELENARAGIASAVNQLAEKPLFMSGFADAAAAAALAPLLPLPEAGRGHGLSAGAAAGLRLPDWDFASLGQTISQATPEIDLAAGAGLAPLQALLDVDLGFLVPGLAIRGSFGWTDARFAAEGQDFRLRVLQAGGALSWRLGRMPKGLPVAWDGIQLRAGFSWLRNQVSTRLTVDPIVQGFTLDLDDTGPLLPMDVTVRVEPALDAGIQSEVWLVPVQLSTGLRLADFLCLDIGGGVDFSGGNAGLSLEGTQDIQVLGFLGGLIQRNGSITISGVTRGAAPELAHGFASACLQFRAGGFTLSLPVAWRFGANLPSGSLSAGLMAGVHL
jgi:hypothetical protein